MINLSARIISLQQYKSCLFEVILSAFFKNNLKHQLNGSMFLKGCQSMGENHIMLTSHNLFYVLPIKENYK
jgi:hypothetical protein